MSARRVAPTRLEYRGRQIGDGTVKSISTTTIVESLVSSLFSKTEIKVRLGPLALPLLGLEKTVGDVLAAVAKPLDGIVSGLLATLGVRVGEMDVEVERLDCGHARIVG